MNDSAEALGYTDDEINDHFDTWEQDDNGNYFLGDSDVALNWEQDDNGNYFLA